MRTKVRTVLLKISQFIHTYRMEKREKHIIKQRRWSLSSAEGEKEWQKYWNPIVPFNNRWAYRLYSKLCGCSKNIVSEPVIIAINNVLNPVQYTAYYSDKNMFDHLLEKGALPDTFLRKIRGGYYTSDYQTISLLNDEILNNLLNNSTKIIIKPATGTNSGRGVELFTKNETGIWQSHETGLTLTTEYLESLPDDIIIQECIKQHPFMAQFNPTSVNTIRIATYRSVKDDKVHILSSVIRMGAVGAFVDNLHMGGHMVRVNPDGTLADFCINQYAERAASHNGIDFSKSVLKVPGWDDIVDFAKRNASRLHHTRLVQHDIMIDQNGKPRYIEFNTIGFSMWIAQMTGTPALGMYTDEIREYTIKHLKDSITIHI